MMTTSLKTQTKWWFLFCLTNLLSHVLFYSPAYLLISFASKTSFTKNMPNLAHFVTSLDRVCVCVQHSNITKVKWFLPIVTWSVISTFKSKVGAIYQMLYFILKQSLTLIFYFSKSLSLSFSPWYFSFILTLRYKQLWRYKQFEKYLLSLQEKVNREGGGCPNNIHALSSNSNLLSNILLRGSNNFIKSGHFVRYFSYLFTAFVDWRKFEFQD